MALFKKNSKSTEKIGKATRDGDLLDGYSPFHVAKIVPTSTENKENVFQNFQPSPGECLDYNISETFVKLDAGDTKIKMRETKASYIPAPLEYIKPKKKKITRSHGGPPQMNFIDEIWRHNQEELQKQHKINFKKFVKNRRRHVEQGGSTIHNMIQRMVGPEWYQELSPKQLITVDQLSSCILEDLKENTIINTQRNIANLGLVLRPNSKHIEIALKYCYSCCVEFLLILYQLINSRRRKYSINDRLLLSAVVHLTMRETLRELHIRIPSPPRCKKIAKDSSITKKKIRYESPYLEPYTFKPQPPKFTGIYENKHVCYPVSPYFSYIEHLHTEMKFVDDVLRIDLSDLDSEERDLLEDMKNAQLKYNNLQNSEEVKLLKPTIKKNHMPFKTNEHIKSHDFAKMILPPLSKLEDLDEVCECPEPFDDFNNCCEGEFPVDCENCDCKGKSRMFLSSLCKKCIRKKQRRHAKKIINGIVLIDSNTVIPIVAGTIKQEYCDCLLTYKHKLQIHTEMNKLKCQKVKFGIGGVVLTKIGPVYLISTTLLNKNVSKLLKMSEDGVTRANNIPENTRSCCYCSCMASKEQNTCYVSDDSQTNESSEENIDENSDCKCRKELDKVLYHKCTCEDCNINQRRLDATRIISGIKKIKDDTAVTIVGGINEQKCNCLEEYLNKLKKLAEYKLRIMTRYRLKSQSIKYAIGGIVSSSKGPVYIISGVRPPIRCECAKLIQEKEELEKCLQRMPKMPPTGRIKYEISGVKEAPDENVYILSRALATEKCPCQNLYDVFEAAHGSCLQSYEEFLNQMAVEVEEYKGEFENTEYMKRSDHSLQENYEFEENIPTDAINDGKINTELEVELLQPTKKLTAVTDKNLDRQNTLVDRLNECDCKCNVTSGSNVLDSNRQKCLMGPQKQHDSRLGEKSDSNFDIKLKSIEDSAVPPQEKATENILKRFIILKRIPSDVRKQMDVLKVILASMAHDGFHLAKLPDCHKLPHFKLWMQMRCKKRWLHKSQVDYENMSKNGWRHTDNCHINVPSPRLGISKRIANTLTWKDAYYSRNLIKNKTEEFYRRIKEDMIEGAREFFPLTFSYEFPTSTFRDCYFAYLPSKEEDLFVIG